MDNAPEVDGFKIGDFEEGIPSYIGRTKEKCINNCDYEIGRIQVNPQTGLYFLDELSAFEKFTDKKGEYLVKNSSYVYNFVQSSGGDKVKNALELHVEGNSPFYIGSTRINDNVHVGKVKPGEGLFFVDMNGKQKVTSSYNVLTCVSSDRSNEIYKERDDESWFDSFGCPKRKEWCYISWKCVCKEEFKGIFAAPNSQWNEDTCSYDISLPSPPA